VVDYSLFLLLDTLSGQLYSVTASFVAPSIVLQPRTAAIAAMASLGTGVFGAPLRFHRRGPLWS
jgi:chloride channel protein, CIC family